MSGAQPTPAAHTGRLVLVPTPCTTDPCLPGLAVALEQAGTTLLLGRQGRWLTEAETPPGWSPALGPRLGDALGQVVTVTGAVHDRSDRLGAPYRLLEVVALDPAADATMTPPPSAPP